ncbi:spore germination protein KC [Paenibacillus rhizosphaerae]|uniref:Spore germination protein KC n=1 Tax=Paenibacillus rhizosphaerae TaxID=297318 RepID=A0A839TRX9_9BACL|nr:Ger(x)C family spore germination protein [Paenibacillus rhizosphaerae]MBB3128410.1 spore germination protein KC [Paenibacillus rhizosphaerae]
MMRTVFLAFFSVGLVLSTSGCTDFVELNQLAFIIGTAIDYAENGQIEVSQQIVIPSKKEDPSKREGSSSFFVMSAKGKDVFQATQKIQLRMSRKLMANHRMIIAISEEYFKKDDVRKLFDKLIRDPANNLRDTIVMIKGGSAKEFLMLNHPIEPLSTIAVGKELQINGMRSFSSRQFVIETLTKGARPFMPVLQIENVKLSKEHDSPVAELHGFAVLDHHLKVKGILGLPEAPGAIWMSGKGSSQGATIPWNNNKDVVSFRLTRLQRQMTSANGHDPKHMVLTVKAQAYLLENTSQQDMSEVENMMELQKCLNKQIQKELQSTIEKVQQWGPDVFGIGEYLHHNYPYWWKSQRDDWDDKFKRIEVTVKTDIILRSIGVSGAPVK